MSDAGSGEMFNPRTADFRADPYPALARLREERPVHWNPVLKGWIVTRHCDVQDVLINRALSADTVSPFYAAQPTPVQAELASLMRYLGNWIVFKDPPDHTRLRSLASRVFTTEALLKIRPNLEAIIADLLAGLEHREEIDLVEDFATRLPAFVIMDMLGVPREQFAEMRHWSEEIKLFIGAAQSTPDKYARARAGVEAMATAFGTLIEEHRRAPRDTVLAMLIDAHDEDNGRLDDDELVATSILLLFAGHETTANLIAMASMHMMRQPDVRRRFLELRGQAQISAAIEEFLRYDGPTPSMVRIARAEHEIDGHAIAAGQRIYAMIAAANRDPEIFPSPDTIDFGRVQNRHVTFGFGTHFCLGAPLARLEANLALPALHQAFPAMTIAGEATWADGLTLRGPTSLPVRLSG